MKYAFAAIALAAVARAQTLGDVPKCAIPCLDEAIKSETTCAIEDLACVCENFSAIQGVATGCVLEACGPEVAVGEVLPAVEKLCANPPPAGTSAAPTSAAPTSAASTSEAGTSAPATETGATTIVTSVTKTGSECTPSATHSGTNTVAPIPSGSNTVVPIPTSDKPAPTPVPTAGAGMLAPLGGLAIAAIGALAL